MLPAWLEAVLTWHRIILEPVTEGRLRIDAGTWGTMGVGLGGAIAAATARPDRLAVAVEGDSAFGFSGMEVETICRCAIQALHSISIMEDPRVSLVLGRWIQVSSGLSTAPHLRNCATHIYLDMMFAS